MLPFGVVFGLFLALLLAAFFAHSAGTSVVCVCFCPFFDEPGLDRVFDPLVADLAAMRGESVEERGGEGMRPTDGESLDEDGSLRFSRGFRNMGSLSHDDVRYDQGKGCGCGVFKKAPGLGAARPTAQSRAKRREIT